MLCLQAVQNDWQEHHKREIMKYDEFWHYQSVTSPFRREIDLLFQCPVIVVARGIHGKDYFEHYQHFVWTGLYRLIQVVATIFTIAKYKSGVHALVYKHMDLLSTDDRLVDLCDSLNRYLELSSVITHVHQDLL